MGKHITLISPPWYSDGKLGFLSHNLGLGYLAAYLETNGHRVHIIDSVAEGIDHVIKVKSFGRTITQTGLPYEEIVKRICPDTELIGLTVPFTMFARIAKELAHSIKTLFPTIPVVLGGVYPSTLAEDALNSDADYVIQGEGEIPLLQLANGVSPDDIKGLCFFRNQTLINNGTSESIPDLDQIPFPARHLLPMEKYLTFSARGSHMGRRTNLITSRGCPFDCSYCSIHPIHGYKWRARSAKNVLEEIKRLVKTYDLLHIEFEDDNMTFNKQRAEEIFDGIIQLRRDTGKNIRWSSSNGVRVDTLDRELLIKMKDSGCTELGIGVENGDPEILKLMNKKMDRLEKIVEIAEICVDLGINVSPFMIVGYPGETHEHFRRSLDFFMKLKAIGVRQFPVHIIKAYPRTSLFDYCKKEGYLVHEDLSNTRNLEGPSRLSRKYVGIITPDFTEAEILKRRNYAHKKLNTKKYYYEKYPFSEFVCKYIIKAKQIIVKYSQKLFGITKKK